MTIVAATEENLRQGAERLRSGQLVAFPTETVYGLGADAANAAAVAEIFRAKGRPADHPLIVHVSSLQAARYWAELGAQARALIVRFWPGPLTLILRRRPEAPDFVCGGQDSIGLRCPEHPVARALLQRFEAGGGKGVAAPSANRFGRISPTTAAHVEDDLGTGVWVLDGGPCRVGIESTIVDLSRGAAVVLRPGAIHAADIDAVLAGLPDRGGGGGAGEGGDGEDGMDGSGTAPGTGKPGGAAAADAPAPRVSGSLASHYAPRAPLELAAGPSFGFRLRSALELGEPLGVLALRPRPPELSVRPDVQWIEAETDPAAYAAGLYARLRKLDAAAPQRILVERPPPQPEWAAIDDRLSRAATGPRRR